MNEDIKLNRYDSISELPITLFKLTTGENIIAITHDLQDVYRLEEPMTIAMDNNIQSWILYPWIPFVVNDHYDINKYNVLSTYSVDDDIKALYVKVILDEIDDSDEHEYNPDNVILH